jgi:1-aminocyclopropane-1-carboxylate deaminase/D-cysteine desulfhydrase-like pyridoxal-dependent ACC family enzyme
LGCWGYIRGLAELAEELGTNARVDLVCATGSCGTQAGLILGRALLRCQGYRILGVPIAGTAEGMQADVRRLVNQAITDFGLGLTEEDTPIELIDGYVGEGYGIAYPEAIDTIRTVAQTEGVLLDPTYTGKAMTAMLDLIRRHEVRPDSTPVFLHTGGAFGLMPQRELFT